MANREALPKETRLRKPSEFVAVLSARSPEAFRLYSDWFEVKTLKNPASANLRFGFTVGKKFAASSVDRNLVRRILKEAARHKTCAFLEENFLEDSGFDICLRLRRKIDNEPSLPKTTKALKRILRSDADTLLDKLFEELLRK